MMKPGWIGGPTNWICHVGGQNLQPSKGWNTHGNSPRRSRPPSWFQRSGAGSSLGKIILHPLPLSASPGTCSSQMNCLIRMCDNSLSSQLLLMPKSYSIVMYGSAVCKWILGLSRGKVLHVYICRCTMIHNAHLWAPFSLGVSWNKEGYNVNVCERYNSLLQLYIPIIAIP